LTLKIVSERQWLPTAICAHFSKSWQSICDQWRRLFLR
jgi:hypothetical protein